MSKTDDNYKRLAGTPYTRACRRCGATHRNEKGMDPCIGELPGVLHACCGHGIKRGYVMFENGIVLRGEFDTDPDEVKSRLRNNRRFLEN